MKLPKISIGKSSLPRKKFNLSCDCNTTADWGSFQPIFKKKMEAGSDINLDLQSFVRLAPMPYPTLSRVNYKVYGTFVPIADIYHPYEQLKAGQSYKTAIKTYVPTTIPYTTIQCLTKFMMNNSAFCIYKGTVDNIQDNFVEGENFTLNTDPNTVSYLNNKFGLSLDWQKMSIDNKYNKFNPDEADYVLVESEAVEDDFYIICFRWSRKIRNFRKILIGLGMQPNYYNTKHRSILPLVAFYKAYFDKIAPKTSADGIVTWTNTHAFGLMEAIETYDNYEVFDLAPNTNFGSFLLDLCDCYYYMPTDFITAHIQTPSLNSVNLNAPATYGAFNDVGNPVSLIPRTDDVNELPFVASEFATSDYTIDYLNILQKLTRFVKKDTIIGGKLNDWFIAHTGKSCYSEHVSYDCGEATIQCNISDVISTTENKNEQTETGRNLGSYAGKGIGFNDKPNRFKFTAATDGYFIIYSVIVPQAQRVQSNDYEDYALTRFQLYTPEFDGMTFEITNKDIVNGASSVSIHNTEQDFEDLSDQPFGFIPLYTPFKVKDSVLNGDLSLRSTRNPLNAYTTDILITENSTETSQFNASTGAFPTFRAISASNNIPTATPELGSIGKYPYLGNFNRIFYLDKDETTGDRGILSSDAYEMLLFDDNFVVHNVFDVSYYSPMKSISESFDTESNKDSVDVKKG